MDKIKTIPRALPANEISDLVYSTFEIFRIPQGAALNADAFVVYPGCLESWRVDHAISYWQQTNHTAKVLLITGINDAEAKEGLLTLENLTKPPYGLTNTHNVYSQLHVRHTKDQTDWVCEQLKKYELKGIALFVSPFHLLRAYLTQLTSCQQAGLTIPMIPMPTPVLPNQTIPFTQKTPRAMVQGELERIKQYQAKGDVASFQELWDYLDWLWHQPIMKQHKID